MKEEFLDYIEDIIEAMDDAMSFVEGMEYDDFLKDRKTIYAVTRAIEIIGSSEKDTRISEEPLSTDTLERYGWNERQINPRVLWG